MIRSMFAAAHASIQRARLTQRRLIGYILEFEKKMLSGMKMAIPGQRDGTIVIAIALDMSARRNTNSKHDQAVSNLFRQCGFQEQPRRRRACRIVIRLSSGRRHVRAHCDAGFLLEC